MTAALLGGIGLFLLGMALMSDGLKAMAGNSMRQVLLRVVRGPWSGLAAGTVATAVVQSSTATTLTTIGFVSAGLLTFPQSIGVILGSNLGTTSTGWIVSMLGLKISLGTIAPPIVLVGAGFRLLGRGRLRYLGDAIAGFALLFIGIDMLQHGMSGLTEYIDPSSLPSDRLVGRLLLVGAGFVMTVIMQSSSAAVATTLVALQSGAIGLEQSAALVIGQNIGTTATAAIAAIGTPPPAIRTAAVHILFNVVTGTIVFAILPFFLGAVVWLTAFADAAPATTLAVYHTAIKLFGVALFIPFTALLARTLERIIPDRTLSPTRFLSRMSVDTGAVAAEAARRSLVEVLTGLASAMLSTMGSARAPARINERLLRESTDAVDEVRRFVYLLGQNPQSSVEVHDTTSLLHAADHLGRLIESMQESSLPSVSSASPASSASSVPSPSSATSPTSQPSPSSSSSSSDSASTLVGTARSSVEELLTIASSAENADARAIERVRAIAADLAARRKEGRVALLHAAAAARVDPRQAVDEIESILRLDRIGYHIWRAMEHLQPAATRAVDVDAMHEVHAAPARGGSIGVGT